MLNGSPGAPLFKASVAGGALHLQAANGQDGVWYQGSTKSLVYKALTAKNFMVTTTAHPRKRTDPGSPPTNALHVGGLIVRDPASSGGATENYVFVMVGSNESAQPGVEVKSTTNGATVWSEPAWSSPDVAELRICRLGSDFYMLKRASGGAAWALQDENGQTSPISRPGLPDTVEVGLALNFKGPDNDLDVAFDNVTLGPTPTTPGDCTSN